MAEIKIFGKDGLIDLTGGKNIDKIADSVADLSKEFDKLESVLTDLKKANDKVNSSIKTQAEDLKKTVSQQKEYNETVEDAEKQAKDLNKQYKESIKTNEKLDKSIEDINKAQEELNQTEIDAKKLAEQREKLEKKLTQTLSGQTDEIVKLKVQQQQANKEAKDRVNDSLGLIDAYTKESKRLNELRKSAKNAALQFGKGSKEFNELRKQVVELDDELKDLDRSLGQNQREVGNYAGAVQDLESRLDGLDGTIGDVVGSLKQVGQAVKGNPLIAIAASLAGLAAAYGETSEGSEDFAQVTAVVGAVVQETVGRIGKAIKALSNLDISFSITEGLIVEGLDEVTGAFDGFSEAVKNSSDAAAKAAKDQIQLDKANRDTEIRIGKLSKSYELLEQRAGDATISLQAQLKASVDAGIVNEKIASERVKQIDEQISIFEKQAKAVESNDRARIALENQIKELTVDRIDAEKELAVATADSKTLQRQAVQDLAELELDVLIDGFDNLKTVNERVLADENSTFQERKLISEQLTQQAEDSFNKQVALLQRFTKEKVDINALLNETDQEKVANELRNLGLSEILNTRSLEVLRERRTVVQDLKDVEAELNKEQGERVDLLAVITAQEERLNELKTQSLEDAETNQKDFDSELIELQKESLQRQIDQLEEGSTKKLELQKDLNDLLLDEEREALEQRQELRDAELEAEREAIKQKEEFQKGFAGAANEILQDKIKSDIARVVISTVLSAIENGEDPVKALGSAAFVKSSLLALAAFEKGGLVEGGEQVVRINEKGQEFVVDAGTTKALGLNKKGSTMRDFHSVLSNEVLNTDKRVSDNINQSLNPITQVINQTNIDYDKIGNSVAKHMPKEQLKFVGEHLAHITYTKNNKESVIFKDPNKILKRH